jgi:hypothetical protein
MSSPENFDAQIRTATRLLIERSQAKFACTEEDIAVMYRAARSLFRALMRRAGFTEIAVRALLTKFNDAGPRSAPWKPVSSRVPGRPQDGRDGNRIRRWELPEDHKFYSTRIDGTLVAIKYIFQALSMSGAPVSPVEVSREFAWLVGHDIVPGAFRDPIQQSEVRFEDVATNPRIITSGHIVPLDRGGRHVPSNTSLMLKTSNDLQGNNTVDELLNLIQDILRRHGRL